jgi:hypothetical protein
MVLFGWQIQLFLLLGDNKKRFSYTFLVVALAMHVKIHHQQETLIKQV